ncbi:MAG: DUF4149 domain-containing protein [Ideonella sp.]|nr:DUF4149 domain-containing protein [Ideonella sp.]
MAGLWAGGLLLIGGMAAPAAFAVAAPEVAGRIAGRLFAQEAHIGLGVAAALVLLLRHHARLVAGRRAGSLFSPDLMLVLGAVFCTVAGYFALQPMMASARAGQGGLSFGTLHGLSAAFFGAKALLVLALAWRLTRR